MKIAIYMPRHALGLSVMLIKNLCWFAIKHSIDESSEREGEKSEVFTFSADGSDSLCFSGGNICADRALSDVENPDAVFISAFWGERADLAYEKPVLSKLKDWGKADIPIAGFSNAPFLMAAAGLLDSKVATVYPPFASEFSTRYPKVLLRSDRAITDAGGLYCANGIASGCDLIVFIIEILFGPAIARRLNNDFLIGFQRGYSPSSIAFDGQKYHSDHQIMTAQSWIERHFKEEINVEALSADRGMSSRNFSRRFKAATGDSPGSYLQRVRLEMARDFLANSDKNIAKIAYDVGYNDSAYFSRVFKKTFDCLPNEYRKKYRHSPGK